MAVGFSEDDFWSKTPLQVERALDARDREMRRAHNDRVRLAWTIAWLSRTTKPPKSLDELFIPEVRGEQAASKKWRQTASEMKKIAAMLTVANGGKIGPNVRLN